MIDKVKRQDCCQCGNCKITCPVSAISFNESEELFEFPNIDTDKCIKCEKCEKVCPVLNKLDQQNSLRSYAVKNKNKNIQRNSSSGGVFSALAESIIEKKGYVFGAAWQNGLHVAHIGVNNLDDLTHLRGSKYVKSDLNEIFNEIQILLNKNKEVLFSGTPCQCAALKVFLGNKKYENLYVVDFICHGILSEKLFDKYIDYLQKKEKSKIISFDFRNKSNDWLNSGPKIVFENGKIYHWPLYEDVYMQGYFQGICMRESCYKCQYKNFYSGCDITLGDYWGADILEQDFFDKMGLSLCCVQTQNGINLFNWASEKIEYREVSLEKLTKYNQGLFEPFKKGEKSNEYYKLLKKDDYFEALNKLVKVSKIEKIKRVYRKIRRKFS